jgi:hypothetical protein
MCIAADACHGLLGKTGAGHRPATICWQPLSRVDTLLKVSVVIFRQLAEVDQALSSGQKPAAKRPRPAAAASPPGDLSFGRLDISKCEPATPRPHTRGHVLGSTLTARSSCWRDSYLNHPIW